MASEPHRFGPWRNDAISPGLWASALTVLTVVFTASVIVYLYASFRLALGPWVLLSAVMLLLAMFAWVLYALPQHRHSRFGYANLVTAIRAALVSLVAATVFFADNLEGIEALGWTLVALVVTALLLDGIDGYLARRFNQASELGARFDMEVDAFLILILSVAAFMLGKAGLWVLLIGLMRYLFVAAQHMTDRLNGELPPSFRRKLVCVIQVAALCVILAPIATVPWSTAIAGFALLSLVYSFAVDVFYLLRTGSDV